MKAWSAGLLPLALLALSSAACLSSVDVQAHDIEIIRPGLRFDGTPVPMPNVTLSTATTFELDSSNLSWAKRFDSKVRVKGVRVVPVDGVQDLGFIESATITLAGTSNPQAGITIGRYQRMATQPLTVQLEMNNPEPVDVSGLWSERRIQITLAITGQLPAVPWTVDVTLELDGEFTVGV